MGAFKRHVGEDDTQTQDASAGALVPAPAEATHGQGGVSTSPEASCGAPAQPSDATGPAPAEADDYRETAARVDTTGLMMQNDAGPTEQGVVVCQADFLRALAALVPSLSEQEIGKYERLRDQYESKDARGK